MKLLEIHTAMNMPYLFGKYDCFRLAELVARVNLYSVQYPSEWPWHSEAAILKKAKKDFPSIPKAYETWLQQCASAEQATTRVIGGVAVYPAECKIGDAHIMKIPFIAICMDDGFDYAYSNMGLQKVAEGVPLSYWNWPCLLQ